MGGNFPGDIFHGWQFSGAQFSGGQFSEGAIFRGGKFPGGNFPRDIFPGAFFLEPNFSNHIIFIEGSCTFVLVYLQGIIFQLKLRKSQE